MTTTSEKRHASPSREATTRAGAASVSSARLSKAKSVVYSRVKTITTYRSRYEESPMDRVARVRRGLEPKDFEALADLLQTNKTILYDYLNISPSTMSRRSAVDSRAKMLHPEVSSRILGTQRLIGQVQRMVEESGDPANFDAGAWVGGWLSQANPAIGGAKPGDLLDTPDGIQFVSDMLSTAESNAYL